MKPKVFKMGGVWLWRCFHDGHCGEEFRAEAYLDPWCAAVAGAVKHWAHFHNPAEGEDIGRVT